MDAVSDQFPLYRPELERDACGIALVADALGRASHETVERGLLALNRLSHRGATGGGTHAIDGAGILTDIPWTLLDSTGSSNKNAASLDRVRALATLFLPRDAVRETQHLIDRVVRAAGWEPDLWRQVPVRADVLAADAKASEPAIYHLVLSTHASAEQPDLSLLRIRVRLLHETAAAGLRGVAVASISRRTVVYKALVEPKDLPVYFPDLADARFVSAVALAHQRFSTNTLARWDLSQPFHYIAHNGEINTISGNRQWMRARQLDEAALPGWSKEAGALVRATGSDSESLDDAVALLCANGLDLPLAMTRLVPPAWEKDPELTPDEAAFYECQAAVSEPWDGPASLAFSDGRVSGVRLDRNGFRPARFILTRDQHLLAGSETGLFDLEERDILKQGRLGPGQMVFVDREAHTIQHGNEISRAFASARPYRLWVRRLVRHFHEETLALRPYAGSPSDQDKEQRELIVDQRLFGMDREEVELIIRSLAVDGKEAVGSMGDDTPPAALSQRPRLASDFFRQRFAQVTNPPMDSLRENSVMALRVWLGPRGDITREDGGETQVLALDTPILTESGLARLYAQTEFPIVTLPLNFDAASGVDGLRPAVEALAQQAVWEVEQGASLLVLSDRDTTRERAPMPALLAVGAVHQSLIDRGCRLRASIIVETGEARDAHQVATLLANGASVVVPYLGLRMGRELHPEDALAGEKKYRHALEEGLLKIFSKMGVSTLTGYCGAQLFETLGLAPELSHLFPASPNVAGTITFARVAKDVLERHRLAFETERTSPLKHFGFHGFRRDGDYHAFNPEIVKKLHAAAGSGSTESYQDFATLVHGRAPMEVRDLLEFRRAGDGDQPVHAIPLDQVESVEDICTRFFASAMSVGALGPEAHRVIAIAMNRMGSRSNSGEGGEEYERFRPSGEAENANSTTKQVASARFGVTPAYLISATELQIKMAQGSKPGEGGQLPATKVVDHIARLRHAQPGTSLISPPPHHDIYSIEDLAQLIFDLRSFHPTARMNVKLVSQVGVGIVAAGVVKCGATAIQLSGHSGGTGASPRGSIKHAGMPWEIGLAETQQILTMNGLRHRVVLQADGGLKTGRDVAIAAALGAEEFGFGTAALVAIGCLMARQCHLNTCPVGIATQRPDLRQKFAGTPEQAIAYFRLVAEDVRRILASLGLRSVQELVGRTDLLQQRADVAEPVIDLTPILAFRKRPTTGEAVAMPKPVVPLGELNDELVAALGDRIGSETLEFRGEIRNTDRTVGARLSGIAATQYGDAGLPNPVKLHLTGSAGQSLGAFLSPGMTITVKGDANDFVGKGMHGGEIVLTPPPRATRRRDRVLAGNSVLYGATGGRLFIAGRAGERFAVRNSGATAVVEGVGEHGCEYMTGGVVVVLGDVGRNFAAGMTGGRAYVYDPADALDKRCNSELVDVSAVEEDDWEELHQLIVEHRRVTGSPIARALLANWPKAYRDFRLVLPRAAEEVKVPAVRTAHARA
jgi:glutamate synthase (ferredoxin)